MSAEDPRPVQPPEDDIRIEVFADWMLPQVIDLFVAEYSGDREREERNFRQFFEHPVQRERGIRLVALDGETVCGFQSFVYWPYVFDGVELNTFQSGRSLVAAAYRGRRIFARLLDHLFSSDDLPDIDFVVGFPVEMSFGSFIRNGWSNPVELSWRVRVVHPLSVLRPRPASETVKGLDAAPQPVEAHHPSGAFSMSRDPAFAAWQSTCRTSRSRYDYFHFSEGARRIRFELKRNRRGRVSELVIGDMVGDTDDAAFVRQALRGLVRAVRRDPSITILSIAYNADRTYPGLVTSLRRSGFIRIKPQIHFIVKHVRRVPEADDPARWLLMFRDVDTW